jgi:uncharacterized protein YprB with RNaseH-like and TPR domain
VNCPVCNGTDIKKAGSILSPKGRVQRFKCQDCDKKFHPSLKNQTLREGFLDIENDSVGRGAGNFGIMYSYAIAPMDETKKIDHAVLTERSLKAERTLLKTMLKDMKKYDLIYTWYGSGHDIPVMRTRCAYHKLPFPEYMEMYHKDLYYTVRGKYKFHSNRLEAVAHFFGVSSKTFLEPNIWIAAKFGVMSAFKYIDKHCIEDVKTLRKVYHKVVPYYKPNTFRSI